MFCVYDARRFNHSRLKQSQTAYYKVLLIDGASGVNMVGSNKFSNQQQSKGYYLLAFLTFAILLALRESEKYSHVYDFLPVVGRTLPFFLLTCFISAIYCFQGGSLADIGLRWPPKKTRVAALKWIFLIALIVLLVRIGSAFAISPIVQLLPDQNIAERSAPFVGNLGLMLFLLPFMWLAVIGEEVLFRGFLMNYIAGVIGNTSKGWIVAIIISSIIFGLGHFWKGPGGMLSSGIAALVFGSAFYLSRKNLWPCIVAHIAGNTLGFISIYVNN